MPIVNKVEGIYIITCKVNNKMYIGQSNSLTTRWRCHKYDLKNNKHNTKVMQEDYNKFGLESFEFKILEECEKEKRNEREKFWISQYKSNTEFGYNLQSGGHKGGFTQAESTKEKMSKSSLGKPKSEEARMHMSLAKTGIPAKNKGVKMSDESKLKMSLAKKGKPSGRKGFKHSEETKLKMSLLKIGTHHLVTEETKKNISESLKGNTNCKGRKLSEEHKAILIESNKNRVWSEESRKKLSENNGSRKNKGA